MANTPKPLRRFGRQVAESEGWKYKSDQWNRGFKHSAQGARLIWLARDFYRGRMNVHL